MRYTKYGTFLGGVLTLLVFIGYAYFHQVEDKLILPYIFIGMLLYFYLVGFYICHKTCSFREGMKSGLIAGVISMIFLGVSLFFAHTVFFYYETISEPVTLARFSSSGLLSIHQYLVIDTIRMGIFYLLSGTAFAGFSAGAGSYTASYLHKTACDNPGMKEAHA